MENLAETIKHIPFFSGLSREDLSRIAGKLEEERFSPGQVIVSQGEVGNALYVVESGAVEVVLEKDGLRAETIGIIGPKESFGEMSLLTGQRRSATVIALVDSAVLKLGKENWEELLAKYPSLSLYFCKVLSQRLVEIHQDVLRGRGAFNSVLEEFFVAQSAHLQDFLVRTSILKTLDPAAIESVLSISGPGQLLASLSLSQPGFLRVAKSGNYEYLNYLRDFLSSRLERSIGRKERDELHLRFGFYFSTHAKLGSALHHYIKSEAWEEALELIRVHGDHLLENESPEEILGWLGALPHDLARTQGDLARLRADAYVRLGDLDAAIRTYREFLARKQGSIDTARYYQELAELHHKKGEIGEALGCLRLGASMVEEGRGDTDAVEAIRSIEALQQNRGSQDGALRWGGRALSLSRKLAAQARTTALPGNRKWLGLLLALAVGWGLWQMPPPTPLDERGMHFLASLAAAVILWIIGVFDEYVVALLLLLAWLVFGIVPPKMALAGFSETSWFFVLGVLGIGAAVNKSGLLYRVALQVLHRIPADYRMYTFILATSGLLVSPILPDERARVAIMAPLSQTISESMGFKPRSAGSAGLALSAYIGFGQMGFVFLTGATLCLIGWNLLPEPGKSEFGWGTWTLAAFPAGIFTLLLLFLAVHFLFPLKAQDRAALSPKTLETQLEILGPLSKGEWLSLAVLVLALIGWLSKPLHGIGEAWVALGAFLVFLVTGVLDKSSLKNNIDWGVLLFLGVLFSLAIITSQLKVDRWLMGFLGPVLSAFSFHPVAFLTAVSLLIYCLRLFLNKTPTVILLTFSLASWAQDIGIHPGVLLISMLMAIDSWFLPYQTLSYQIAYYSTDEKAFSHAQARKLMAAKFLVSLLAIAMSVPYWRMLGFIK